MRAPRALLALLALLAPTVGAEPGLTLVLPAEARPATAGQDWISQAVAEVLSRDLAFLGLPVISNEERQRAHELLEIPDVAVTRATSIRMAEALGARRVALGSFGLDGARLSLSLRLLDVERGTLSAPLAAAGPLDQLRPLLHGLAWDLALAGPLPPRRTKDELLARDGQLPFEAFRLYCQALRPGDPARRRQLLREALRRAPGDDDAELALGRLQLEAREYAAAVELLGRVSDASPAARGARFLQGVASYELGRYREAAELFARLAQQRPSAATLANHGLALARAGATQPLPSQVLRSAVDLEPGLPDLALNLGWALLFEGDGEAAAFWLRGLLRENARDLHARVLLCWALRRAGRAGEAEAEWKELLALAPGYATLASPDRSRRFERLLTSELSLAAGREARTDAELAAGHANRAERLLEGGDARSALAELNRAVYLDPHGARVHRLLARAHRALADPDQAVGELRMSLWCREDVAVRAELAELLAELGRASEARGEAQTVLKSDPANAVALRVLGRK